MIGQWLASIGSQGADDPSLMIDDVNHNTIFCLLFSTTDGQIRTVGQTAVTHICSHSHTHIHVHTPTYTYTHIMHTKIVQPEQSVMDY